MKLDEAVCYFSLFMSTLNLNSLYYILFKPKIQREKKFFFIHALYSCIQ